MAVESAQLVRPAEIAEWDIQQARRLIELAQVEPLPSLLGERDLMSCLYYPLRQVPLPQFQFEMLLWDTDKLNVFSATERPKLSFPKAMHGILEHPAVLYKRADDFTVLALVYSLESRLAAVFTNEISQTSWEIVGVFSAKDLPKLLVSNRRHLHAYNSFEDKYTQAKNAPAEDTDGEPEDAGYWDRYDKELNSKEAEPNKNKTQKTDEEYWKMYDQSSEEEDAAFKTQLDQERIDSSAADGSLPVKMILQLVPLYRECGLDGGRQVSAAIRSAAGDGAVPATLALSHQIAWNHTRRTATFVKAQFGCAACEQAVDEALKIIEEA